MIFLDSVVVMPYINITRVIILSHHFGICLLSTNHSPLIISIGFGILVEV